MTLSCRNTATFPIEEPSKENLDNRLFGVWQFEEDTDKNNSYDVTWMAYSREEPYSREVYEVVFWNWGRSNPNYDGFVFLSVIAGVQFINVRYWDWRLKTQGFFFLKILETNNDLTKITTATVADTTMRALSSSQAVRERILANLNNPAFYRDTVHFFKVE